jgi:transcriptional regulator with XRE-family HTH domain
MMVERSTVTAARRAFGKQLAGLRAAENLTQAALAKLLDCSRSTVANIETGYQLASPGFCRKCDDVLSTGGVLRTALDELEELQRESHRRAAALAQNDRKARIEEWCQQGLAVPENPGNGAAVLAIRQALATLHGHASDNFDGVEPGDLETCVLDAYQQQRSTTEPLCVVLVG